MWPPYFSINSTSVPPFTFLSSFPSPQSVFLCLFLFAHLFFSIVLLALFSFCCNVLSHVSLIVLHPTHSSSLRSFIIHTTIVSVIMNTCVLSSLFLFKTSLKLFYEHQRNINQFSSQKKVYHYWKTRPNTPSNHSVTCGWRLKIAMCAQFWKVFSQPARETGATPTTQKVRINLLRQNPAHT